MATELVGPVHVIGTGLLGTSIGLALSARGVEVWLSDLNHEHVRTACSLGAGAPAPAEGTPQLVVVAVPPDHVAKTVILALEGGGVVTDVGSVKAGPLEEIADHVPESDLARYVGGHPMAGNERSGPLAASASLFDARPWAVTPHVHALEEAVELVEELALACGATPLRLSPVEHDHAVARTSHLPHLLAVLAAGQLTDAQPDHLALSGQGVRDITRVAAGDPELYSQIIRANAPHVREVLVEIRDELGTLIGALAPEIPETDAAEILERTLMRGNAGRSAIPAKHGGPPLDVAALYVVVPDTRGELARLFVDVDQIGVNIEDLRIEHDPGRPVGVVELWIAGQAVEELRAALEARGWVVHR